MVNRMPWILRDTPQPLWSQLQEKARRDRWPLKALILQLAQDYVDGKIAPSGAPPPMTDGVKQA